MQRFREPRLRGCCGGGRKQRCTVRAWLGSFREQFPLLQLSDETLVRRVWTGSLLTGFGSAMNERDLGLDSHTKRRFERPK